VKIIPHAMFNRERRRFLPPVRVTGIRDSVLSGPPRSGFAGSVFVDDPRQCSKRFVDFARIRKHCGHIGLQHYDRAACRITRNVFVRSGVAEIVFWKDLVFFGPTCFSFLAFFLHSLSVPEASPVAR
jgi:hypothetical protein